jgi:hypothetical protein
MALDLTAIASSVSHISKKAGGRGQRAEGRRKDPDFLSFCLLPPALCLKLTELWLAQVKTAVKTYLYNLCWII